MFRTIYKCCVCRYRSGFVGQHSNLKKSLFRYCSKGVILRSSEMIVEVLWVAQVSSSISGRRLMNNNKYVVTSTCVSTQYLGVCLSGIVPEVCLTLTTRSVRRNFFMRLVSLPHATDEKLDDVSDLLINYFLTP